MIDFLDEIRELADKGRILSHFAALGDVIRRRSGAAYPKEHQLMLRPLFILPLIFLFQNHHDHNLKTKQGLVWEDYAVPLPLFRMDVPSSLLITQGCL